MNVAARFTGALDADCRGAADPDLLPGRLARAAAAGLPADGAGMSLHLGPDLRIPLAGSDEVAETVERLQFTVGNGPCLLAAELGVPVFAPEDFLARRWPAFCELLVTNTPIRGVLALPLPGRLAGVGALDLYFTDSTAVLAIDVFEASAVAGMVSEHLERAVDWSAGTPAECPPWMGTPTAGRRARLWVAMGMVAVALGVPSLDALALLRAHAYADGRAADDLAADLVEGRIHSACLSVDADNGQ